MKKKLFKKLIYITFICFVIIFVSTNSVFAELNPENMHDNTIMDRISGIISTILGIGMGALGAPLISLAFMLLMVIFSIMYFLFSPVSGGGAFPFPDQIIFNKLAFFDPNFLNPPAVDESPVHILQGVISNMYYSFYLVAAAIFLIAIMVISIKLAISTIASDKAQYKKALTNWAFGLLLLFILPFLMAGIFKLNETIVNGAYKAMGSADVKFTISLASIIGAGAGAVTGGVGTSIVKAVTGVLDFFTGGAASEVGPDIPGYGGMILKYMVDAAGGDLVGLIISGILLGQTAALIFQYTKRLFYCIVLGMIAPLIIAADIIKQGV
ncbi:MAG: hypothetical protein K0R72_604 [Clostridia bacterium]|jgi:hypothetical protein|nr:hypothetical protein [Clostridia bacterium]